MDKARAKTMAKLLAGQVVNEWVIGEYINCGKSAVVFKASKDTHTAAIKIFDPELDDRYGAEVQNKRIEREMSLIGKKHPYLVEIFDGGYSANLKLHFIVMELLDWKNLAEVLPDVPLGEERLIISQIASAARYLEELEICHRDIKPENIAVSRDFRHAKLLDLGVIKPHGAKPLTDATQAKIFIGTLKYSPPEFLLREEKQDKDGWRAITFYQLGAVLHDLIMRRPLFADFDNPYARLVNAVQHENPVIESKTVPPALVELARYCLLKPPVTRLQLVSWDQFEHEPKVGDPTAELRSRIIRRNLAERGAKAGVASSSDHEQALSAKLTEYARDLETICRLECVENKPLFPPIEIHLLASDDGMKCLAVQFDPSTSHGIRVHMRLQIVVRWIDGPNDIVAVEAVAFADSSPLLLEELIGLQPSLLFKGVYARDTLRSRVATALYAMLNEAQQVAIAPSSGTKPAITPLKLEEMML
jgi:serine/threonine protein kinase